MPKVSIVQAAKMAKISRSYFYKKYIKSGKISVSRDDGKPLIDIAELIRVFGEIHSEDASSAQVDTPKETVNTQDKDKIIALLERQLVEAKEREEWLKAQVEKTTVLLEDRTIKKRKKFLGLF